MSRPEEKHPETRPAEPATQSPPDSDAPTTGAVRECSDRVAQMEQDLEELRARLKRVQDRHARVLGQR